MTRLASVSEPCCGRPGSVKMATRLNSPSASVSTRWKRSPRGSTGMAQAMNSGSISSTSVRSWNQGSAVVAKSASLAGRLGTSSTVTSLPGCGMPLGERPVTTTGAGGGSASSSLASLASSSAAAASPSSPSLVPSSAAASSPSPSSSVAAASSSSTGSPPGRISTSPTWSRSGFSNWLISASTAAVVPKRTPMSPSVSPGCTM